MAQTFGVNSNNDVYIGDDGNLVVLSGLAAVMAACRSISLSQLGEMVLATGLGIPNFQAIWVGTPNYQQFESYLRSALLGVLGVIDVQSISLYAVDGVLTYVATISTIYGPAEVSNVFNTV